MATAYINIGSNIGDRIALIERAVVAIESCLHRNARIASPIESEPWGFDSPNRFINVGIAIEIDEMPPDELLRRLQDIERSISTIPHRDATGAYVDRAIDIDLIAIDSLIYDSPSLSLPHPRMHLRPFVLLPMLELAPRWSHPILHLTPSLLLQKLNNPNIS